MLLLTTALVNRSTGSTCTRECWEAPQSVNGLQRMKEMVMCPRCEQRAGLNNSYSSNPNPNPHWQPSGHRDFIAVWSRSIVNSLSRTSKHLQPTGEDGLTLCLMVTTRTIFFWLFLSLLLLFIFIFRIEHPLDRVNYIGLPFHVRKNWSFFWSL